MYSVRKIFRVPIGHRLSKHKGLCKNIHGHNLKIEVQLKTSVLNCVNDMVMDFKDIKEMVNYLIKKLDHCTLLNTNDKDFIKFYGDKKLNFDFIGCIGEDPTAEVLSRHLYTSIHKHLKDKTEYYAGVSLDFVRVWENDDSMAEYRES